MGARGFLRAYRAVFGAAALALSACVPLPEGSGAPAPEGIARPFRELDPGHKTQAGLHFEVHAYGSELAREASEFSERLYARVMQDSGLYSFMPRGLYPVFIYANAEEFHAKTGLPSWSQGAAVNNALCSYEGPHLPGTLAHEMTHLIFHEYVGRASEEHRWVNEGLAVYEEQEAMGTGPAASGGRVFPFREMVAFAPLNERERGVDAWYAQASGVVRFMIERGGRVGFGQFLAALRDGAGLDEAVRRGFPGKWASMADLEKAWAP